MIERVQEPTKAGEAFRTAVDLAENEFLALRERNFAAGDCMVGVHCDGLTVGCAAVYWALDLQPQIYGYELTLTTEEALVARPIVVENGQKDVVWRERLPKLAGIIVRSVEHEMMSHVNASLQPPDRDGEAPDARTRARVLRFVIGGLLPEQWGLINDCRELIDKADLCPQLHGADVRLPYPEPLRS